MGSFIFNQEIPKQNSQHDGFCYNDDSNVNKIPNILLYLEMSTMNSRNSLPLRQIYFLSRDTSTLK